MLRRLFPLLLIVACSETRSSAGQMGPGGGEVLRPAVEISTIAVPLRMDLGAIAKQVDTGVEPHFAGTARERGIDIEYDVARDPIRLTMVGAGLHSSTTVKYALQACRGRFPCISCGFGEPRRIADVKLHTSLSWDPAWRLRSKTTVLPVDYARPCQVTWLGIDITRRFVAPVVERQLAQAARVIDQNVPARTNLRPQAQQVWTALQTPYEVAPRTWLVLEPSDVALTPIRGADTIVTTTLLLKAQTRIVLGAKPSAGTRPLPPLKSGNAAAADGIRIPFDLDLPYEEASRLASRDYAGKTYRVGTKPLTLESIRLAPAANGRVLVEAMIDYRGGVMRNYRGMVYLEGTPRFDPATSSVVVPDLDYSLDPKRRGFFGRIAERAAHESIRARLRDSARFAFAPQIAQVRSEVNRALTRELARGVSLRGQVDTIEPQSVTPLADVIVVRVVATGQASVDMR